MRRRWTASRMGAKRPRPCRCRGRMTTSRRPGPVPARRGKAPRLNVAELGREWRSTGRGGAAAAAASAARCIDDADRSVPSCGRVSRNPSVRDIAWRSSVEASGSPKPARTRSSPTRPLRRAARGVCRARSACADRRKRPCVAMRCARLFCSPSPTGGWQSLSLRGNLQTLNPDYPFRGHSGGRAAVMPPCRYPHGIAPQEMTRS